ncbi:MAG: glycosyltransferase [Candidatus Beckwithbacteria bacterium]
MIKLTHTGSEPACEKGSNLQSNRVNAHTPGVKPACAGREIPTPGVIFSNISIIIPCKSKKDICPELLPALKSQSLKPKEIIIVPDIFYKGSTFVKILPHKGDPATKRDYAAKKSVGTVLTFIDSDAYPDKNWLKNATKHLKPKNITAVCGPGLTPSTNTKQQKVSGLVWSTLIGAGPYYYRNRPASSRFVDDYPTFNLLVKKKDFLTVNGFDTKFWPGEDTKLCLDLTYKLNKKILYHPSIFVYHHRRPIFLPHLQQVSRYGFQRGRFVRLFPQTSRRLSYFIPLFFLLTFPLTWPIYLFVILLTGLYHHSLRLPQAIFLTHLTYAIYFIKGLLIKIPHEGYEPSCNTHLYLN